LDSNIVTKHWKLLCTSSKASDAEVFVPRPLNALDHTSNLLNEGFGKHYELLLERNNQKFSADMRLKDEGEIQACG
jgi:hypothetical protein